MFFNFMPKARCQGSPMIVVEYTVDIIYIIKSELGIVYSTWICEERLVRPA